MVKATDDTVRLIWEVVVESDRTCRYYGYLAVRLNRLGNLLLFAAVAASSNAVLSLLSNCPEWLTVAAGTAAASAGVCFAIQNYPEKAARIDGIRRALSRQSLKWQHLWADVHDSDNAELKAAWRDLTRRQAAVVEHVPLELPLSQSLARLSRREADRYWTGRHADSQVSLHRVNWIDTRFRRHIARIGGEAVSRVRSPGPFAWSQAGRRPARDSDFVTPCE